MANNVPVGVRAWHVNQCTGGFEGLSMTNNVPVCVRTIA